MAEFAGFEITCNLAQSGVYHLLVLYPCKDYLTSFHYFIFSICRIKKGT